MAPRIVGGRLLTLGVSALLQVQFRAFKAMLKFKRLCDEYG